MMRLYFFLSLMLLVLQMEGQVWRDVGGGINHGYQNARSVNDMIVFNDSLYVVGIFDSLYSPLQYCSGFAVWDSSNYQCRSGTQIFQSSLCIGTYQSELVIGSDGTNPFQPHFSRIRRISGGIVYPFGNGIQNGQVRCLQEYNGELYVGGNFTTVDSTINANRIARWDGNQWHAIGTGVTGGLPSLYAMAKYNGELYVGGNFSSINGFPSQNISRFDGVSWDSLNAGVSGFIFSMLVDSINDVLYVGGAIGSAGEIPTPCGVAKWDGNNWSAVGTEPIELDPKTMIMYKGKLFAGGVTKGLNSMGQMVFQMAWFDGQNWNPVCDTMDGGEIQSLCVYQDELYVGGYFKMINDSALHGIARTHFPNVSVLEYNPRSSTVKVYPNPTSAILNLKTETQGEKINSFALYSTEGNILNSKDKLNAEETLIDLTNISTGIYFIRVHTSKGISNIKILKE
ncbi:MAG: T9SS type A sorting domain-containing protein [Bacteroidetes bacterium]|nr:T9SS type A sorting domain-containing protein [Bacteroidota bacterium]